jgi:hypothetical protein
MDFPTNAAFSLKLSRIMVWVALCTTASDATLSRVEA